MEGSQNKNNLNVVSIFSKRNNDEGVPAVEGTPLAVGSHESNEQVVGDFFKSVASNIEKPKRENEVSVLTDDSTTKNDDNNRPQPAPNLIEEKLEETVMQLCKELKFNLPASNFSLVSFFPDSMFAVVLKNGYYYTANLGSETVDTIPYLEYETILITDSLVVLDTVELDGEKTLVYLTEEFGDTKFKKPSLNKLEAKIDDAIGSYSYEIVISKKTFNMNTKSKVYSYGPRSGAFKYPLWTIKYNLDQGLVYEDSTGVDILLANDKGCYVGFYLPLDQESGNQKIVLGPDLFESARRLTQTVMVLTNSKTKVQSILTCTRPILVDLPDLGINDAAEISVVNGVAMISQEKQGSSFIHVFTPKHQRIITERGAKVDSMSVGNGVYLPTEGLILLEDGRLVFAREVEDNVVVIRKKEVQLPQQYLEID